MLSRENRLLSEMFDKRKLLKSFRMELALELVGYNESRIRRLVEFGVLTEVGGALEIADDYRNFFEEVLDVNEEISVLSVQECINSLKEYIGYYLQENNEKRRYGYQDAVRQLLRKTGLRTLKNVVDLKRSMDDTYKQEPNYKIKKQKLENLDEKSHSIRTMIRECEKLLDTQHAFFLMSADPHMALTVSGVRAEFSESYHALMEIDSQIIAYINQIERQNQLYAKIRKLKYLQDQFTIKEETNLLAVLEGINPLWMESRQYMKTRLPLEMFRQKEEWMELLRKVAVKNNVRQQGRTEAEALSEEDLRELVVETSEVDKTEVWNAFAATGYDLFDFLVNHYDYRQERSIEDHATLFCQMLINHPDECRFSQRYAQYENLEYPLVYAK